MVAPEKIKEFNKALTNKEIAEGENNARKQELYVVQLEEKYDGKYDNWQPKIKLLTTFHFIYRDTAGLAIQTEKVKEYEVNQYGDSR